MEGTVFKALACYGLICLAKQLKLFLSPSPKTLSLHFYLVPVAEAKFQQYWHMRALMPKTSQLTNASTTVHTQTTKPQRRSSPEIPLPFPDGALWSSLDPEREWTMSGSPQMIHTKPQITNKLWWHRQKISKDIV